MLSCFLWLYDMVPKSSSAFIYSLVIHTGFWKNDMIKSTIFSNSFCFSEHTIKHIEEISNLNWLLKKVKNFLQQKIYGRNEIVLKLLCQQSKDHVYCWGDIFPSKTIGNFHPSCLQTAKPSLDGKLINPPAGKASKGSLLKSGTKKLHPPVYWVPLGVCHSAII